MFQIFIWIVQYKALNLADENTMALYKIGKRIK